MRQVKRVLAAIAAVFLAAAAEAAAYRHFVDVSVDGYEGSSELKDFPLLVRVSESGIPGFKYSDVTGGDCAIRFTDAAGEELASECDTWDPNGESLFWVKVPSIAPAGTKIRMWWGVIDGETLPDSHPESVWGDYIAVWHMGEDIDAERARTAVPAADSTGHGLDAVPTVTGSGANGDLSRMISTKGKIGRARVNDSGAQRNNSNCFRVDRTNAIHKTEDDLRFRTGSDFTFSLWMKVDAHSAWPHVADCKSAPNGGNDTNPDIGWNIELRSGAYNQFNIRGSTKGSNYHCYVPVADSDPLGLGFRQYVIHYKNDILEIYANGEKVSSSRYTRGSKVPAGSDILPPGDSLESLWIGGNKAGNESICGEFDEIRLRQGGMGDDWIKADYQQQSGERSLVTFGALDGGESIYWNEYPKLVSDVRDGATINQWKAGETVPLGVRPVAHATSDGDDVPWRVYYENLTTGVRSTTLPDESGSYDAVFYVPRSDLVTRFHFDIIHETPFTLSSSDRVLVFSVDTGTISDAPITDPQCPRVYKGSGTQNLANSIPNTNESNTVYWKFENLDACANATELPNLQPGTVFELWAGADAEGPGRRLWHFDYCRLGNMFLQKGNSGTTDRTRNYLPVSVASGRFFSTEQKASAYQYGSTLTMLNTSRSCVYSPCYENGIGTIYFDAVNDRTDIDAKLAVEVCTGAYPLSADGESINRSGVPVEPTDENCAFGDDPFARCIWSTPVPVYRYVVDNGEYREDFSGPVANPAEIPLDCTIGTPNYRYLSWFRIRTEPLNLHCKARFRIRRVDGGGNEEPTATGDLSVLDGPGLATLDNIVCTEAAVSIGLSQFGVFRTGDPSHADQSRPSLGQCGAFSVAFPSFRETNLFARAKVTYDGYTNSTHGVRLEDLVSSMNIKWRWRRLNQTLGPWNTLYMHTKTEDREVWQSIEPIKLVDSAGEPLYGEGDIEYRIEALIDGPYAEYHDYAGTGGIGGAPGYTERVGSVVCDAAPYNSLVGVTGTVERTTYIRLREGASAFEGVSLVVHDGSRSTSLPMDLVGDRLWRVFLPATNTVEKTVSFLLEGVNRQVDGATEYPETTTPLCCTKPVPRIPCTLPVEDGMDDKQTLTLPSSHLANYIAFTYNEGNRSLSIGYADMQTFDNWNSSRRSEPDKFYGSLYDTNTTAAAFMYRRYPASSSYCCVTNFQITSAYNKDKWYEPFSGSTSAGYPVGEQFESTKTFKGWTAEWGSWASQQFSVSSIRTGLVALNMRGGGFGRLTYFADSAVSAPRGLDAVSFKSRLSQLIEWNDISYSRWGQDDEARTSCTLVAQVSADDSYFLPHFDGDASISMILGYVEGEGCYEYRVTIYNATTNAVDSTLNRASCLHAIYKWSYDYDIDDYAPQLLYETDGGASNGDSATMDSWWWNITGGANDSQTRMNAAKNLHLCPADKDGSRVSCMFFSISNDTDAVYMTAGVTGGENNKKAISSTFGDTSGTTMFCMIAAKDESPLPQSSAYGFATKNCPAKIYYPSVYQDVAVPVKTGSSASGSFWVTNATELFETPVQRIHKARDDKFVLAKNRLKWFDNGSEFGWGYEAETGVTQLVSVETCPISGESVWTSVAKVPVSTFCMTTNLVTLRTPEQCHVRFRTGQPATGVVLDDVELTQWCGDSGTEINGAMNSSNPYNDYFYYNHAWVSNKAGKAVCVLAPRRSPSPDALVAVRSPNMSGLGSLVFKYEDADPGAELLVQWRPLTRGNMNVHTTGDTADPADSPDWETLDRVLIDRNHTSDIKTYYLGVRSNGVFRVAIPQETVRTALTDESVRNLPNWRAVTITDIFCTNEPEFDSRAWWGWNFLTTGWKDGVSSEYSSMWDGGLGGVGVLNSSAADVNRLANGKREDYEVNNPFFQTPTFTTNWIGEISFRTRAFDALAPSCVTVWGAASGDLQSGTGWTPLTNVVVSGTEFRRVTYKCADEERYRAVRVGVANAEGITGGSTGEYRMSPAAGADMPQKPAMAIVDDVVVSERGEADIGFRLDYARPFRLGLSDRTAVLDIASRDQQPLLGEQFGFQAEVTVGGAGDDIDLSITPRVYVSYYEGDAPWGYSAWKDLPAAKKRIELLPAEGTNLVYRSSIDNPESFVAPQSVLDGEVYGMVQYYFEVRYWKKGETADMPGHYAPITSEQWEMPSWNAGFVSPNSDLLFSPFTLLDTVSPGRAWINEVNWTAAGSFSDARPDNDRQFIELCFPAGVDMTGWRVYRLTKNAESADPNSPLIEQDLMFVIGFDGVPETKAAGPTDAIFAFMAITDRESPEEGFTPYGEIDARWRDSSLEATTIYGFQLVRPSNVIEEQIVIEGQMGKTMWSKNDSGLEVAGKLNGLSAAAGIQKRWQFVGDDTNVVAKSAGVFQNVGDSLFDWNDYMTLTPGRKNENQTMPEDWFIPPTGANVWLTVTAADGNTWVIGPDGPVPTLAFIVPQDATTNVPIEVAQWHRLSSIVMDGTTDVTADAVPGGEPSVPGRTRWAYPFAAGDSTSVKIVVSSQIDESVIVRGDLDPNDPYTPAVMDWLIGGTANGKPFVGTEISTNCIHWGISARDRRENGHVLPLRERYWLDIDPTDDNWDVRTGWKMLPGPKVRYVQEGYWPDGVTNTWMTVFFMISNKYDNALSYPPYRLQGLSGEKSDMVGARNWTSETFKVTAALLNGETGILAEDRYFPMRSFVFVPTSFGSKESNHPYQATIEVIDNRSSVSPGFGYGWGDYSSDKLGWKFTLDPLYYKQTPELLVTPLTWDGTWQDGRSD